MSRWKHAPGACRKRCAATFRICTAIAALGLSGNLSAAPAWSPPQVTAEGDVEAAYYSALTVVHGGVSDQATRDQAIAALPLQSLSPAALGKARQVTSGVSLYRRLPTLRFAVDREAYGYFLQHPDVAVSTWRAMEISKFELRPLAANTYHADARDGSVGTVEVWKSTPEETLIYCDGAFKSPLLARPIVARSIMHLRTRFFTAADGSPQAEHTGDVLVAFPSLTVETVARLISPVSHMIADRNFKQLTLYVHLMSAAMSRQPGWIESIARRMDATEQQRRELLQIAATVRRESERRAQAAMLDPLPVDEILAPLRREVGTTPVMPVSVQVPAAGTSRR